MLLRVRCVQLETELAFRLGVIDPVRKVTRIIWIPKSYLHLSGSYCEHGQRDFFLEVPYLLSRCRGWEWLIENEQEEYREFLRSHA